MLLASLSVVGWANATDKSTSSIFEVCKARTHPASRENLTNRKGTLVPTLWMGTAEREQGMVFLLMAKAAAFICVRRRSSGIHDELVNILECQSSRCVLH